MRSKRLPRVHGLPESPTPLIGRGKEIKAARQLLLVTARLVTFTGPPGVGKTRLALAVAGALAGDFRDGAAYVDLTAVTDPALVLGSVAQAVQVTETPDRPLPERLKQHLQDRHVLLLLDNFEHVVEAAPQIADLLEACPALKMLVTSRAPLQISWEHRFPVPPLGLPDPNRSSAPAALKRSPAVSLFVACAKRVEPDFAIGKRNARTIADICVALDGLPLAIELAAARVGVLPPEAMLGELRHRFLLLVGGAQDLPPRHQTLRAALDWSRALLRQEEQVLFRRLSVFVGGCTLEAAAAVCADVRGREADLLRDLQSLIDKGLLQQHPDPASGPRFRMLATIREYAAERLVESGEEATIHDRHLAWCLDVVEPDPVETGKPEQPWLDRVHADYANMRAALEWSQTATGGNAGLRLAGWLGHFWYVRGPTAEGRKWLAAALERAEEAPSADRAQAAGAAGALALASGDLAAARSLTLEALAIRRGVGDTRGVARRLVVLGWVAVHDGDLTEARRCFEECLSLYRQLGQKQGIANALDGLGRVASDQNDRAAAQAFFKESLAVFREIDQQRGVGLMLRRLGELAATRGDWDSAREHLDGSLRIFRNLRATRESCQTLAGLGKVLLAQGEYAAARACYQESLAVWREQGVALNVPVSLCGLGEVAVEQGDLSSARALFEESLAMARALGDRRAQSLSLNDLGDLAIRQGDHMAAHASLAESVRMAREIRDQAGIALALESFAGLAIARRHPERTARLLGAAEALRDVIGVVLPPTHIRLHKEWLAATRTALNSRKFDELWTQGKAMALELAIDDAVKTHDAAIAVDRSIAPLSIRLLGGLEVRRGDILLPEQVWGRKRDRLLFAYLLIAGQPVSREALLDALWPNLAPAAAGASLRVAWSRLKRALEPGLKEGQPSAYLEAEAARFGLRWSSIATDVLEFERLIVRAGHVSGLDQRVSLLESAAALYRGDLLPEDANEPWTVVERERLRSIHLSGLQRLAEVKETLGRPEQAAEAVWAILRAEPWREEAYRWLMRLLARLGRRSEALHLYRQCEIQLRRELNVAPAPETIALFEAITANRSI